MGNSSSKAKAAAAQAREQLDAAEKKYVGATQSINTRDKQLAGKEKELSASKTEGANASKEAESLRKKVQQLAETSSALEQARQEQIGKLQSDLNQKVTEAVAHRRVADSMAQERDAASRRAEEVEGRMKALQQESEDRLKALEERNRTLGLESEQQKKDLEERITAKEKESAQVQSLSEQLQEHIESLEQNDKTLTDKATAAKTELATETQNRQQAEAEAASTQQHLADSEEKRHELQRTLNEGVSKRAAQHETLQAMRVELKEAHERYRALHQAHEELKTSSGEKSREATKGAEGAWQKLNNKTDKHGKENVPPNEKLGGVKVAAQEVVDVGA